jgi:hypothetical protein
MIRNLVGSICGRSSIKRTHSVSVYWQTWPPQAILFSDWLIFLDFSPLKPFGQMNRNLVGSMSKVVGSNNSYKPITNTAWVRPRFCKLQKGCTRLVAASDKVYQLLTDGRWLSPGAPASSTTKAGRHDIAEILLRVALKHQKSKIISIELEIKDTTDTDRSASYLDLHLEIDSEGRLRMKLRQKRWFQFSHYELSFHM